MRVLLLQLDGKLPNYALMRIAAHHRDLGDEIEFRNARTVRAVEPELFDRHEKVYASLIFDSTRPVAERLRSVRPDAVIGGTGLPGHAGEASLEDLTGIATDGRYDYSIYPKYLGSIGFTQRGCRLRCGFCGVWKKRGEETLTERLWPREVWRGEPYPRHLTLLDNDFFGQPSWREKIREMREGGFKVCFTQGINARLLDDESAAALASLDYRDTNFVERRIYTAWDNRKDEERLFSNLRALVKHGIKPGAIIVYMLIGYWAGETFEEIDYRRRKLREFGARPYPMPYVRTPELVAFQRWVLCRSSDKTVPWDDWLRARGQIRRAAATHHQRSLPVLQGVG